MSGKDKKITSFGLRQLVISNFMKMKSYGEISELLNIKKNTVGDIERRFKKEDRIFYIL